LKKTRTISWADYCEWVQGKRIVGRQYGALLFHDGTTADLITTLVDVGCETCGDGRQIDYEVRIEEDV